MTTQPRDGTRALTIDCPVTATLEEAQNRVITRAPDQGRVHRTVDAIGPPTLLCA